MKNKKTRKILSLFLAICLAIGMVQVTAKADDGIEVSTPEALNNALKRTTASIINVTADLALPDSVTLGASHTLHIQAGNTVVTKGDYNQTLTVPAGITLTLTGPGTLKANNSANGSIGIVVGGTLKLEPGSRLEAANTGTMGVYIDTLGGKLISNGGHITVSGSGNTGIASDGDEEVKITGGSLTIKNIDGRGFSAGAINISAGCEVTIESEATGILAVLAEIKDSMVSISNTKGNGIQLIKNGDKPNGLTISNCTVNIANKSNNGIVSDVAISLVNKTVVNIKNTAAMGLRFTDALLIEDSRINTANSGGTMLTLSGKVSGANGGTINLVEGAAVTNPLYCISDRGVFYKYAGLVTITAGAGPASDETITAGEYIWDGEYFLKSGIADITISPENSTVRPGDTVQFTATVEGAGNYSEEVDWTTSCTSCTISDGLLTVCSDTDHSSAGITVTATSQDDNTVSAAAAVTIEPEEHTHNFGTDWKSDATGHWHVCECGEKSSFAEHTPGEWIIQKEATETTEGSKYKKCTACGYITETKVIPATGVTDDNHPVITNFGTWKGTGDVSAKIDADHTKFLRLLYKGKEVDSSGYTITSGSTVITIKESYLKTLGAGAHIFIAEFADGVSDEIKLTVNKTNSSETNSSETNGSKTNSSKTTVSASAKTGDSAQALLYAAFLLLAVLVGAFGYQIKKRMKYTL